MMGVQASQLGGAGALLATLALPALADAQGDAIQAALGLCTSPKIEFEQARRNLLVLGWVAEDGGAQQTLFHAALVSNFRSEDLEYTISNAMFMAASALGNASLSQVIEMRRGDIRLAILGDEDGQPRCVVIGPDALADLIGRNPGIQEVTYVSSPVLRLLVFHYPPERLATITRLDVQELGAALTEAGFPGGDIAQLEENLSPVTLQIFSPEVRK